MNALQEMADAAAYAPSRQCIIIEHSPGISTFCPKWCHGHYLESVMSNRKSTQSVNMWQKEGQRQDKTRQGWPPIVNFLELFISGDTFNKSDAIPATQPTTLK